MNNEGATINRNNYRVYNIEDVKWYLINHYLCLINRYMVKIGKKGLIKDPTKISPNMSEGQAYWQLISTEIANIDKDNASDYQKDFDYLWRGTQDLMKIEDNIEEFSITYQNIMKNSISNIDLDIISSLIKAQKLVEEGLWDYKGYERDAIKLIKTISFFTDDNLSIGIMDHLSPTTCLEIARFCHEMNLEDKYTEFWEASARNSLNRFEMTYLKFRELPNEIEVNIQNEFTVSSTSVHYSGIKNPWRLGEYFLSNPREHDKELFLRDYFAQTTKNQKSLYKEVDSVVNLSIALAIGEKTKADMMLCTVMENTIMLDKYYENTIIILGLLKAIFPG